MNENTNTHAPAKANGAHKLPDTVLAQWLAEDWDDDKMTASRYTYETEDGRPVEAGRYAWGQTEDNNTGGCQRGDLRLP